MSGAARANFGHLKSFCAKRGGLMLGKILLEVMAYLWQENVWLAVIRADIA
jgi:hypothetical protein